MLGIAAAWSLIPFGVWWAGASSQYYTAAWEAWLWGTLLVACVAAIALMLTRGRAAILLVDGWRRTVARQTSGRFVTLASVVLAALALLMCLVAFSGNPRNVDGFAQLFQARIFLAGRLWVPPPAELANFATLHMIVGPVRWFSQYPPGQSLVLALGLALGAWWLLNPIFVALLVVATYRTARWCADETTARLAVVLLCLSPFVVAVSGSEMSHLPAAALGMIAAAAAVSVAGRPLRGPVIAGAVLGVLAAFRPLDAVAAAVPVALVLLLAAPPGRRVPALAAAGVAGALFTLPFLWYNAHTTGSWHELGYNYLWGPSHSLGFHPVPWGIPLTPARAVGLTSLDLHQIDAYLFDAPFPVLLLVAAAFFAGAPPRRAEGRRARRRRGRSRRAALLLLAPGRVLRTTIPVHGGAVAGDPGGPRPRAAAPLGQGSVPRRHQRTRGDVRLRRRDGGRSRCHHARPAVGVSPGDAGLRSAPGPGRQAGGHSPGGDRDPGRLGVEAHRAHVGGGRPPFRGPRASTQRSTRAPSSGHWTRAALDAARLGGEPLLGDAGFAGSSPPARRSTTGATLDPNLRLPDRTRTLAPACRAELARDSAGFLAFAPFLYLNRPLLDGDIVWARDLGPWNAALFARYADRPLYRYAPLERGGPPAFTPLQRPAVADGVR